MGEVGVSRVVDVEKIVRVEGDVAVWIEKLDWESRDWID